MQALHAWKVLTPGTHTSPAQHRQNLEGTERPPRLWAPEHLFWNPITQLASDAGWLAPLQGPPLSWAGMALLPPLALGGWDQHPRSEPSHEVGTGAQPREG